MLILLKKVGSVIKGCCGEALEAREVLIEPIPAAQGHAISQGKAVQAEMSY
jgi:hypothetical protein